MGNQQQNPQNFNPKEWTMVGTNPNQVTLWQNNHNRNIHIEEYRHYTIDQEEFARQRQLYFERKNHPYWVAAYYFQQEKSKEICVSRSIAHVFIEKIPIKIFDLRDLPLPDLIHAHNQCLEGYKALAQSLGCFRVMSQFIGVNQKGIVKVWAGPQWSQIGVISNKISQEQMVRSIIESLQTCSQTPDHTRRPISFKTYLYRNTDKLTFDQAIHELRNFSFEFNQGFIPNRLQSLYDAHRFEMFLDPLQRSNHHLMQHSKNMTHMSSTNLHDNFLRSRDDTSFRRVESGHLNHNYDRRGEEIRLAKPAKEDTFFNCMNDQEKLKTSKLVTKEEVLNSYSAQHSGFQHPQNVQYVQYQQVNAPPARPVNFPTNHVTYAPITHQNAVPFTVHQVHPIREQKVYQNPFIDNAVPQEIHQHRSLQPETLYHNTSHNTSQHNISQVQIHYNTNQPKMSNFNPQQRINPQFTNVVPQRMYEVQPPSHLVFSNQPNNVQPINVHPNVQHNNLQPNVQPNVINRPIVNQPQPQPPAPATIIPNKVQFPNKPVYNQGEKRKRPIPQSIIMQLYTSQDKFANNTNQQSPPLKSFGLVKQSISQGQDQTQLRFDSATIIKDVQHNNLTGVPHNYYFNTNTNLHSIQELSSQHHKTDNISQASSPNRQRSQLFQAWGQSGAKRYDSKFQVNSSYQSRLMDPNDGKTPQDLLRSIRQLSNSRNVEKYSHKVY